jgi:hypothetical protein
MSIQTDGSIGKDPYGSKEIQAGSIIYAADAGSNDTYVITLDPIPAAYTTGMVINFKANTINTGNATLNVNGLGAKNILKNHDQTLSDGDIEANQLVTVIYDGTQFQMQSQLGLTTGTGAEVHATSPDIVTPTITVPVITHTGNDTVTAAQMKGQFHIVNGAYTPTLPTAVPGYSGTFTAQTAAAFSLDPANGADVLYLNGTALAAGNRVTSDGSLRAAIFVKCILAGFYEVTAMRGIFVDGGS